MLYDKVFAALFKRYQERTGEKYPFRPDFWPGFKKGR